MNANPNLRAFHSRLTVDGCSQPISRHVNRQGLHVALSSAMFFSRVSTCFPSRCCFWCPQGSTVPEIMFPCWLGTSFNFAVCLFFHYPCEYHERWSRSEKLNVQLRSVETAINCTCTNASMISCAGYGEIFIRNITFLFLLSLKLSLPRYQVSAPDVDSKKVDLWALWHAFSAYSSSPVTLAAALHILQELVI